MLRKLCRLAGLMPLALLGAPGFLWAGPAAGVGVAIGVAASSYPTPLSNDGYASFGGSLAADLQFVVNESWSLNPYLMLSGEGLQTRQGGFVSNGVAGFEVRRWEGERFFGLHVGAYSTYFSTTGSSANYYDPGLGASLGAERESGITYSISVDLPRAMRPVAEAPLLQFNLHEIGVRLHVGYRWR